MAKGRLHKMLTASALALALGAGAACGEMTDRYDQTTSNAVIPWPLIWNIAEAAGLAWFAYELLNSENFVLMTRDSFYWRVNQLENCGDRSGVNPVVMGSPETGFVGMNFEAEVVCVAEGEPRSKEEWKAYLLEKMKKEGGR